MKKATLAVAVPLVLGVAVPALAQTGRRDIRIAMIAKSRANPVFEAAHRGAQDAAEKLSNLIAHHIAEEELTILEPARTETSAKVRFDLGAKWAARRNELIDQGCGSIENVRRVVAEAEAEGLLDEEE